MSQKTKGTSTSVFKKHPISVSCALLSIILIAVIFVRHGAIPSVAAELDAKMTQGSRLKANISHSTQLAEQYEALISANAKVSSRLVRASELSKNQQYFYRLEAETATKYNDLRPPPTGSGVKGAMTNYVTVPYTLAVEGGYLQLLTFLRRLENGASYCRIISANLARATNDITNPKLVLSLNLELLGQP